MPGPTDVQQILQTFTYMAGTYAKQEEERDAEKSVLEFILETLSRNPNKFLLLDLATRFAQNSDVEFDESRNVISRFIMERGVAIDNLGKLYLFHLSAGMPETSVHQVYKGRALSKLREVFCPASIRRVYEFSVSSCVGCSGKGLEPLILGRIFGGGLSQVC